jgi:hypothetical protein
VDKKVENMCQYKDLVVNTGKKIYVVWQKNVYRCIDIYIHTVEISIRFNFYKCILRHVSRMEGKRSAYRILVGKPESRRPVGMPRHRWEDNIKQF